MRDTSADDAATGLAALVTEVTRDATAAGPAPRLLPHLWLEHASGTSATLLDGLWTRGIFRKYEHVLEVGAGLGGHARWMVARLGCTVVGTTRDYTEAAAGMDLTRRTGVRGHIELVPADAAGLPFRDARFTHVWYVEALPRIADVDAACAEARRVLRPGGYLALQELVPHAGAAPPALAGWRFADAAVRVAALEAAGFVEVVVRDVTRDAAERTARVQHARARLAARLAASSSPALRAVGTERDALARLLADGVLHVVQMSARRAA